jgi:putative ABC transport system permease protein
MFRACLSFAWANLIRGDRMRFLVAVAGATVAIFALLLHVAFLRAVEHKAIQVYALFDAPVVLVSDRFQFLYRMADFPTARLRQALSHPGVANSAAVRVSSSSWTTSDTRTESSLLLIGIDFEEQFLADAGLRAALPDLRVSRRILLDRRSDPSFGEIRAGLTGSIGAQLATVAGVYELGLPMYASGTAIVANTDFGLYTGGDPRRTQLGLLQLKPGADAAAVVADLKKQLPDDVRVMTRAELMQREADFFLEVKPLGIMMRSGLLIGLMVGAVALFQVMSSQVEMRMRDFAVLRAMGFEAAFTYEVCAFQLALTGALAFAVAWALAVPTLRGIAHVSHLSMPLDGTLLWVTAVLCAPMMATAAVPLARASRADPARLF